RRLQRARAPARRNRNGWQVPRPPSRRIRSSPRYSLILCMESALRFGRAAPPHRPFIFAEEYGPRARPATNARIALVVQRIIRNVVLDNELPNFLLCPIRQRADLYQLKLLIPAHNGSLGPVGTLVAANCARPSVHTADAL